MVSLRAARETHGPRKHMYKHTREASMVHVHVGQPMRLRLRARTNIHEPPEHTRSHHMPHWKSEHMCESNGTMRPVQMADGMCVMSWANG